MARSSATSVRRGRAVESFRTAAECIGELVPGLAVFGLTRGQFSMIDAVLAVLDQTGPAAMSLWTWAVAEYEMECLERLRTDQRVTDGRLVIDGGWRTSSASSRGKNAGLIQVWKAAYGPQSVRYVLNHAKIATVHNDRWRVLLRGSFNLNYNPRFEQFDLTEGGPDFDLVHGVEMALPVLGDDASGDEVYAASGLSRAFSSEQLTMFRGVRTWTK